MNKSDSRKQSKKKNYYSAQKRKTRDNKIKRILKSQGKDALNLWIKEHPILTIL